MGLAKARWQNWWRGSMTRFVARFDLEMKTSGIFGWRACASTSATCPATQFSSRERSPPTSALCSRQPLTTICKKPFGASDSHLSLQPCPKAFANESGQEAANFPEASVNGLPSQGPFCSTPGFSFWTRRPPVLIRPRKHWCSRTFGAASVHQLSLLSRIGLRHFLHLRGFLFFRTVELSRTVILTH